MVEHWFYHLEQSSLEQILPELLEKTYANKWRALVKIGPLLGEAPLELKRLDDYLWAYKKDGFLPHGRDDEPLADAQPILLSVDKQSLSGEDVILLIGGAEMGDVSSAKRCITILNGADDEDKTIARTRWKQAKDDGLVTAYWRQNDFGKWEQPFK
ncbi:MAG: DNA polymerase III subunit chi [Robiginitomaculum sp.]|nr:DNA polymerase III subunit chi [Robiginitomaculum sp.]